MLQARPLRPGELDHEAIWLAVSLAAVAAVAVWFALALPLPGCAFHHWTGAPCVGCGGTRSLHALLHADFASALRLNPGACFAFAGIALYDLYAACVLAFRLPRIRFAEITAAQSRIARTACVLLLALNWIYVLHREAEPLRNRAPIPHPALRLLSGED